MRPFIGYLGSFSYVLYGNGEQESVPYYVSVAPMVVVAPIARSRHDLAVSYRSSSAAREVYSTSPPCAATMPIALIACVLTYPFFRFFCYRQVHPPDPRSHPYLVRGGRSSPFGVE